MNGRELKCERDEKSFRGRDIISRVTNESVICKEISNEGEIQERIESSFIQGESKSILG